MSHATAGSAAQRRALLAACVWLPLCSLAQAQTPGAAAPAEIAAELPAARLQGAGTLRFMGLRINEARLWTTGTPVAADWAAVPFALEVVYARDLSGERIAKRSIDEMKLQGEIDPEAARRWLDLLKQFIPDVKAGDRITGLNRPGQGVRFFVNAKPRGETRDAEFARWFFGIWLSPRTSEPALRTALLGTAQ
jgi:hypothetical protein